MVYINQWHTHTHFSGLHELCTFRRYQRVDHWGVYISVGSTGWNANKHFHVDHVLFLAFYFGHWERRAIPRDLNSAGWHHISWQKESSVPARTVSGLRFQQRDVYIAALKHAKDNLKAVSCQKSDVCFVVEKQLAIIPALRTLFWVTLPYRSLSEHCVWGACFSDFWCEKWASSISCVSFYGRISL